MSRYLDIGPRFVGDLHDELAALVRRLAHQLVEDEEVDSGAQVVNVGHKDVLLPLSDELVQQAGVGEASVDVAVSWRVPGLAVLTTQAHVLGDGQQRLLVDPWVPVGEERAHGC